MLKSRLALVAAASTFALAGCQYWPWNKQDAPELSEPPAAEAPVTVLPVAETPTIMPVEEPAPVTEECGVLEGRDWEAWINKMPGVGMVPTLHVTGKVDVRTSGYTFEWKEGPMDRSAIPALRLKLVAIAPEGMVMQAITTETVKYETPALPNGYSSVIIGCGDTTLAEITEIPDAH